MSAARILIVEDDAFKLERITKCLERLTEQASTSIATSVQSAVAALVAARFDIVLLDMALPSHELRAGGGPPSSLLSGGIEVILELSFLKRPERVIVVTQYPEIEIEGELVAVEQAEQRLKSMYEVNVAAVILYKHDETEWETALVKTIE